MSFSPVGVRGRGDVLKAPVKILDWFSPGYFAFFFSSFLAKSLSVNLNSSS